MTNLKNKVDPLHQAVPITDASGRPTPEFMRKWEQQKATNGSIPDLTTAAAVSAILDLLGKVQGDILYRDVTLWQVLAPGAANTLLVGGGPDPQWDTLSALLDTVMGSARGAMLFRAAAGWTLLAPGTNGFVLTMGANDPAWAAPAGGAYGPLVNGDTPGPALVADPDGQCIMVSI